MPQKQAISEATRHSILDAAWQIAIETESLALSLADLAKAVGVSRQTLYLAFGSRSQLLLAMLDNRDMNSPEVRRLIEIRSHATGTWEDLKNYVEAWLDYLPQVYPVAQMLFSTAAEDPVAAEGYRSRFHDRLRMGFRGLMQRLELAGTLAPGMSAVEAGDIVWSLVHPTMWRLLVVESGWPPAEFRKSRIELVCASVIAVKGA